MPAHGYVSERPARLRALTPRRPSQLNKRGQVLIVLGLIWVILGINVVVEPNPASYQHMWMFTVPPVELRAGAWILTGLTAVAFSLRPTWVVNDGVGFLALYLMPAERAVGFLWGWIDYLMPSFGGPGYARGLVAALVYLALVVLIMVIATWPDPPQNVATEEIVP